MMVIDEGSAAAAAVDLGDLPNRIAMVRETIALLKKHRKDALAAEFEREVDLTFARITEKQTPPPPCPGCGLVGGAHWGHCSRRTVTPILPDSQQIQRIKSPYKGREVKALAHSGWRAPSKASLPARSLRLPDGRLLVYQGPETIGGSPCGWWITADAFKVCASVDPTRWGMTLHLSMSYPDHDPTWEDILQVRYTFYPHAMDIMMVLPRDGTYVNVHQHVFQLRPCPEEWNDAAPISKPKGVVSGKAKDNRKGK